MKKTITGFIIARQYEWESEPTFTWVPIDPTQYGDKDSVVVCEHSIEVEIPKEFDYVPHRVSQLRKRKDDLAVELHQKLADIDEQINKLLALPAPGQMEGA